MRFEDGVFTAPLLARRKWLRHAFGTRRAAGDLRFPVAALKQIHSDIVHVVEGPGVGLAGDALVTATPGLALEVGTADCLPLLLADLEHRAIAAVHAGWRGTLQRIVEKALGVMRRRFGTQPARVLAALGPAIHSCCYQVGEEVIEQYRSQFAYADELFDRLEEENPADVKIPRQKLVDRTALLRPLGKKRAHLDLEQANYRQLLDAGVPLRHIARGAPCTACHTDLLHSYRKEGPSGGRMLTQIAMIR